MLIAIGVIVLAIVAAAALSVRVLREYSVRSSFASAGCCPSRAPAP